MNFSNLNKKRITQFAIAGTISLLALAIGVGLAMKDETPGAGDKPVTYGKTLGSVMGSPGFSKKERKYIKSLGPNVVHVQLKPLLRELSLEKKEVCPGEDVIARAIPSATAERLRYTVHGQIGRMTVLRFSEPGSIKLFAAARQYDDGIDYKSASMRVLKANDSQCVDKPLIQLRASRSSRSGTAEFEITKISGMAKPARIFWDFGDGKKIARTDKFVSHSFAGRPQSSYATTYLVKAHVIDINGKGAVGRATISFVNTHYLARLSGNPIMPAHYNRFPKKESGAYKTKVTFRNLESEPIRFIQAKIRPVACASTRDEKELVIPSSRLLTDNLIGAGAKKSTMLKVPHSVLPPDTCQLYIAFHSDTPITGNPIRSYVNLELRAPALAVKGSSRGSVKVKERRLRDELALAARILGRNQITPADLKRLRKQGKLKPALK